MSYYWWPRAHTFYMNSARLLFSLWEPLESFIEHPLEHLLKSTFPNCLSKMKVGALLIFQYECKWCQVTIRQDNSHNSPRSFRETIFLLTMALWRTAQWCKHLVTSNSEGSGFMFCCSFACSPCVGPTKLAASILSAPVSSHHLVGWPGGIGILPLKGKFLDCCWMDENETT